MAKQSARPGTRRPLTPGDLDPDKLFAKLRERGLTQADLARFVGVTTASISQYMMGLVPRPHYVTLGRLARALGCSVRDLLVPIPDGVPRDDRDTAKPESR